VYRLYSFTLGLATEGTNESAHYAVTGVSCGIGAEIAIGASVSRSPGWGFDVGQPSVGLDDFEGLFGITAVVAVSVYYLCHHVLPRHILA
jgi:hypothetical protein